VASGDAAPVDAVPAVPSLASEKRCPPAARRGAVVEAAEYNGDF
jgi:hypothetical protein